VIQGRWQRTISNIVSYLVDHYRTDLSIRDRFRPILGTATYRVLLNPKTRLWLEAPGFVLEELDKEVNGVAS
jgi:hypothetical protein